MGSDWPVIGHDSLVTVSSQAEGATHQGSDVQPLRELHISRLHGVELMPERLLQSGDKMWSLPPVLRSNEVTSFPALDARCSVAFWSFVKVVMSGFIFRYLDAATDTLLELHL